MSYVSLIIISSVVFLTCLVILKFDKIKKFFSKFKLFKHTKKTKGDKGKANRLKPVETQMRPILKPPEEHKLLNEPKKEQQLEVKQESNVANNDAKISQGPSGQLSFTLPKNQSNIQGVNYVAPFTANNNKKYKTQEELDQEFNEIRNFLGIPNTKNKKAPAKTINVVDEFKKEPEPMIYGNTQQNKRKTFFEDKSTDKNIINVDGDDIDLNKLPSKMRMLLVANILNRKNYD